MPTLLDTDVVAPPERLAYWTDMICSTYVQLECDARASEMFAGSIRSQGLPGLDLSVVDSRAQTVRRTRQHIARANDDFFLVSLQMAGSGIVRQDGRDAVLRPGDFALYDSTRAYELRFDGSFRQAVLKLPGEQLRRCLPDTEKLTAIPVSGREGAGHLMIGMLRTLWQDIDTLQPASAAAVAGGVLNILVAGLQTLPAAQRRPASSLASYHLARIKRLLDTRLRDPSLSVAAVAAELGLSLTHVHRLFRLEGTTPAQYVWSRRLEACSRELVEPRRSAHSISDIAFSWGFNDAAHFSRSFRERFGVSPRQWRAASAPRSAT